MKFITSLAVVCLLLFVAGCNCEKCGESDAVSAGAMGSPCAGDCKDRTEPCEKGELCCKVTGKCEGECTDKPDAVAPSAVSDQGAACASSCDKAASCDKKAAAGCAATCDKK